MKLSPLVVSLPLVAGSNTGVENGQPQRGGARRAAARRFSRRRPGSDRALAFRMMRRALSIFGKNMRQLAARALLPTTWSLIAPSTSSGRFGCDAHARAGELREHRGLSGACVSSTYAKSCSVTSRPAVSTDDASYGFSAT